MRSASKVAIHHSCFSKSRSGQQPTRKGTYMKCSPSSWRAASALLDGCNAVQVASSLATASMGLYRWLRC